MNRTYEQLIPRAERDKLEQALCMNDGYLLDFSDRTFSDFFYETLSINVQTQTSLFNGRGTSKAKRFRSFVERAPVGAVAKLSHNGFVRRQISKHGLGSNGEQSSHSRYLTAIAGRFAPAEHTPHHRPHWSQPLERRLMSQGRNRSGKRWTSVRRVAIAVTLILLAAAGAYAFALSIPTVHEDTFKGGERGSTEF